MGKFPEAEVRSKTPRAPGTGVGAEKVKDLCCNFWGEGPGHFSGEVAWTDLCLRGDNVEV